MPVPAPWLLACLNDAFIHPKKAGKNEMYQLGGQLGGQLEGQKTAITIPLLQITRSKNGKISLMTPH